MPELVGFYHPWSDTWLLLEWELKPEAKIADLEMLSSEWLRRRGEPPLDLKPDWLRRDGFRVEQLGRAAVDNARQLSAIAEGNRPWREALRLDEHKEELVQLDGPAVSQQLLGAWLRAEELALGAGAFDEGNPAPPMLERLRSSCNRFLDPASPAAQSGRYSQCFEDFARRRASPAQPAHEFRRQASANGYQWKARGSGLCDR